MKASQITVVLVMAFLAGWVFGSRGAMRPRPSFIRESGEPTVSAFMQRLEPPVANPPEADNNAIPLELDQIEKISRLNASGVDIRIPAFRPDGRISDRLAAFLQIDTPGAELLTKALVEAERRVLSQISRQETVSAAADGTLTVDFPAIAAEESALLQEQWRQEILVAIDPRRLDLLMAVAGAELFSKVARFGAWPRRAQVRFRSNPTSGAIVWDVDESVLDESGRKTEMRGAKATLGAENFSALVESFPWITHVAGGKLEEGGWRAAAP